MARRPAAVLALDNALAPLTLKMARALYGARAM
jgi:hypothetical protein